jgi:hypothetical protein
MNLKRNWFQHQLLAMLWLVFLLGLVLGLLALYLLRQWSSKHKHCCKALQGFLGACGNLVSAIPPSYHPVILPVDCNKSAWGSVVHRLLPIMRGCWYAADVAIIITLCFELLMVATDGGPAALDRAVGWQLWWLLAVTCAPVAVTMVLSMPSVLSAYGFLDFVRVRFSMGCCVLLFFSFAWVVFLMIVCGVGCWFIVLADMYMLVALCGVPERKLLGNKLNVITYTTLRFMCQGVVHALPSALISTSILDALLVAEVRNSYLTQLLWASLLLSMSRFAG